MPYQFTQTGQEIQDILDQVPTNTADISSINGILTQSMANFVSDCDNAIEPHKWYYATSESANTPYDAYWTIVPIRYSGAYFCQLAFLVNSQSPIYYIRNKNASSWGSWRSLGAGPNTSVTNGVVTSSKPTYSGNGGIGIVHFANQIPARTYASTDILWTVTPHPREQMHCIVMIGSTPSIIAIDTNGGIHFNSSFTLSAAAYIIGQCVFRI